MRAGELIFFVDESTFSPKSYLSEVWQMPKQEIKTTPKVQDQRCVAAIGAIELMMGKVHLSLTERAAKQEHF